MLFNQQFENAVSPPGADAVPPSADPPPPGAGAVPPSADAVGAGLRHSNGSRTSDALAQKRDRENDRLRSTNLAVLAPFSLSLHLFGQL